METENINLEPETNEEIDENVLYVVQAQPSISDQLISAGVVLVASVAVGAITYGALTVYEKARLWASDRKALKELRKAELQAQKATLEAQEDPTE